MESEPDFKARFTTLFESLPDAVYLQTTDGRIIDCNPAATSMTGFTREELLDRDISGIFDDDLVMQMPSALGGKNDNSCSIVQSMCRTKDGGDLPVSVDMRRFLSGDEAFVFLTVRDITERKRSEEEINRLLHKLKQSRKLEVLGRLTGGITHYYNNIFTGIINAIDVAKRGAADDALPVLLRAQKAANLASGFTRRLLSFVRDSGEAEEPTDIGALIDDVEDFTRLTFDRRIAVTVRKADDLSAVIADPSELHHLLLNLVVNARDALLEKQKTSRWNTALSITIDARNVTLDAGSAASQRGAHKGRFVRVTVSDTGCGMEDDMRERIFDTFFTTKATGKGTGLGLATALDAVRRYSGWMEVESAPGKGSTFSVYFPAVTMKKAVARDEDMDDLPRGDETVLIVDDDEMIRSLGAMTLEGQGFAVKTACDGEECLDIFLKESGRIDLIVLDLRLPRLSGSEVLEKIRRVEPGIPVVITSGHDFERDRKTFTELKADDYLLKPFTIADLTIAVRSVLDRKTP